MPRRIKNIYQLYVFMLKRLALLVPKLRNLHAERNNYALAIQRLEAEKSQLQVQIELHNQSGFKSELKALSEQVSNLSVVISGFDEKIDANLEKKIDISCIKNEKMISLSNRGLFVVGHARSGTTILLDALNSSRDVYCLGEANLHKTIERTDFCSWFNAMHRSFNNPLMKSSYLPDFLDQSGWDVLRRMSEDYKLIGEKVAFRQEELGYDYASFFNFSAKHFQSSIYICVIRHPRTVTASDIEMFQEGLLSKDRIAKVVLSQLQTYYLILSLTLTLPNVFVLMHEKISQVTFDYLGKYIGIDLAGAGSYYDFGKTISKLKLENEISDDDLGLLLNYYKKISKLFDVENLRPIRGIDVRNVIFELYSELKLLNHLPIFP